MSYRIIVEIRDILSGTSGLYLSPLEYSDDNDEGLEFYWSEGNFGCDCNRSICLNQALGGTNFGFEKFPELECNLKENTLLVEIRERGSGRLIYSDMEHKDDFLCLLPEL